MSPRGAEAMGDLQSPLILLLLAVALLRAAPLVTTARGPSGNHAVVRQMYAFVFVAGTCDVWL